METQVIDDHGTFNDKWLDMLDRMTKVEALSHVTDVLNKTIEMRDRYQSIMLGSVGGEFEIARHGYVIDCNNIIKLKRLRDDIYSET